MHDQYGFVSILETTKKANYPDERFGGIILLYPIVSAIAAIPYIKWQQQRAISRAEFES